MVVLILSAAPASLRGSMTRWLLEVSPGIFAGISQLECESSCGNWSAHTLGRGGRC